MMSSEALWSQGALDMGSEEELRRRCSLALPTDTVRGFSLNTVLGAVQESLGPEGVARCLAHQRDKHFVSLFNYPVRDYLQVLYSGAWMLSEKHGGFEQAVRRIAQGIAPGFFASGLGKAFQMMTAGSPKQFISSMPLAFRSAASFGECRVTWTGPRSGVLTTRRDFLLYLNHEGGLVGLFHALKLPGAQVRGRQVGPLDNEVAFSWE
jgi:uncharacterized protein (TIGR02265 family)